MATIKGPLSGKVLSDASPDGRKPSWHPDAPDPRQMAEWVMEGEEEPLRDAFSRFSLPTTNLLHDARTGSMVDLLVSNGANINEPYDYRGRDLGEDEAAEFTPLQAAAAYGRKEVFDRLLDLNADIDAGGNDRPLMRALGPHVSSEPYVEMANTLLDRGARVQAEPGEMPALNLAVKNYHQAPLVKRLLESGADPQQGFENEGTPLHHVKDVQPGVADLLLDYGANKNAPKSDEDPMTPLEAAVFRGQTKTVTRLIEREADVTQVVQSENWAQHSDPQHRAPTANTNRQRIREAGIREAAEIVHVEYEMRTLRQAAAEATHEQEQAPAPRKIRQRM